MRKPTSAKAAAPPTPSAQPRLELKDIGAFPPNLTHRTMYVYVAQQPNNRRHCITLSRHCITFQVLHSHPLLVMPTRPWKTQSLGRNQPSDFGSVISTSYKFSFKWATWLWCYNSRRHRAYLLKIVSWVFQDTVQKDHKPLKALPPLFVWIVSTLFERHYWLKVSATESFKSTTTEFNVMLPALKWQVKTNSQILFFLQSLKKISSNIVF